jgi:hypothetical protein
MAEVAALVWHHQFLVHKFFTLVAVVELVLPIQQMFRVDLVLLEEETAQVILKLFMVLAHQVLLILVAAQVDQTTKVFVEVLAALAS